MARRIIKRNGKTYLVTVPDRDPFCDSAGGYTGGSYYFSGSINQFLSIPTPASSKDFVLSTGSFTVEWFQYALDVPVNDRIFTQGVWPTAEFGVSIENFGGGIKFFPWIDGGGNIPAIAHSQSVNLPYTRSWHHFAMARSSGSYLQLFQDGQVLRTFTTTADAFVSANISSSLPIFIGGEGDNSPNTTFEGYITNFRLVKGYALYSGSYTVPTSPLTVTPGTVLLLTAWDSSTYFGDQSGTNKTVTRNSVSWSNNTPFY